jgi:molybdopterin-guanine dinucleotide biosynthesis protein A
VLLVGGASRRFGSPKALARLGDETLAERAYRTLREAFDAEPLVIGKATDELALPFPVRDDGTELRAAIVGLAAALRLAVTDLVVVVPTDMPWLSAGLLRTLAQAASGHDVAVVQTGPLPGAYRRSALPILERRIDAGELALRGAVAELRAAVVDGDPAELRNVNAPDDLR